MNDMKLAAPQELTLEQLVEKETADRKVLTDFIKNHMVKETDYGSIVINGRVSKPSLFKSGAEKIGSLLRLRPDVVKDEQTWEMAGKKEGLFCYRCNLYNKATGELVGMGLGACSIAEKSNVNTAIKIAKKRAFVDAILTTGALSDFFTQDLEDIRQEEKEPPVISKPSVSSEPYATDKQQWKITQLLKEKGKTKEDLIIVCQSKFKTTPELLRITQASQIIERLVALPDEDIDEEIDIDAIDKALEGGGN